MKIKIKTVSEALEIIKKAKAEYQALKAENNELRRRIKALTAKSSFDLPDFIKGFRDKS
jgi:cell division protein FtsB